MPPLTPDQAIANSAQFGPFVYLVIVLIFIFSAAALLIGKYVVLPDRTAHRENSAKLTDAVVIMSGVLNKTHDAVNDFTNPIERTDANAQKLVAVTRPVVAAIQKVADKTGTDIRIEMGQVIGILHD